MASRTSQGEESSYRESRRDRLLSTCAELIARKGFASTTVRDIGEAAGLLSGSLYYYFDSKESMLEQIIVKLQAYLWQRYDEVASSDLSPRAKLEGVLRVSLDAIDQYNDEVRVYQNESKLLEENERFQERAARSKDFERMVTGILRDGIATGEFRADLRIEVAFRFIRDSVWTIVHWYRPGGELGIDEVAKDYLSMLFGGIASPNG